jgi:hypothetical protein
MRKVIVGMTLLLAATAVLLVVQSTLAGSSGGSEQVVFATANGPTDFNYVKPTPRGRTLTLVFGFGAKGQPRLMAT